MKYLNFDPETHIDNLRYMTYGKQRRYVHDSLGESLSKLYTFNEFALSLLPYTFQKSGFYGDLYCIDS